MLAEPLDELLTRLELQNTQNGDHQEGEATMMEVHASKDLWVDKYKSYKFFDLLTEEKINRNVLTWLKSWDEIVHPAGPKVNLSMPAAFTQNSYQGRPGYVFKSSNE